MTSKVKVYLIAFRSILIKSIRFHITILELVLCYFVRRAILKSLRSGVCALHKEVVVHYNTPM